jgi:hypothetical protein
MSIISIDFEKQVNEIEEFILYHCVIQATKKNSLYKNSSKVYVLYEFSNKDAFYYINTKKEVIYNELNNNSNISILFTSIDKYKLYICFKQKRKEPALSDADIYTSIINRLNYNISN